jgi:cell division inhibitor SepF
VNPQPVPDEQYERKGFWTKVKETVFGAEDLEDEEVEPPPARKFGPTSTTAAQKAPTPLRLQTARGGSVAVRLNAQVFEDAKLAADGLKCGEYQVVNLEKATPQMAERIIDFLNGVCYALDGTVERVGSRVYMFVPANVSVDVDSGVTASAVSRRPLFGDSPE